MTRSIADEQLVQAAQSRTNGDPLNPEQRQAVEHTGGPLIVLAGPGTGKTGVLIHRIRALIADRGADPESILAVTFTNKAAEELRSRLAEMLGSVTLAQRVLATTFHSLGLHLVRRFADQAGWVAEPEIIDEARQRALMRSVIHDSGIGVQDWYYDPYAALPATLKFIAQAQNNAIFPADALEHARQWRERLETDPRDPSDESLQAQTAALDRFDRHSRLYELFETELRKRGWVTFDNLQTLPIEILRQNSAARAIVHTDHRHLLIDEFQDANVAQIELLKLLAPAHHDIAVVGDDDQSIYAFRGATQSAFSRFAEHWKTAQRITLTRNYRSTTVILAAADEIIRRCTSRFEPDKTTIAQGDRRQLRLPILTATYEGTQGAGSLIARFIQRAVDSGAQYSDFAILTRSRQDGDRIAISLDVAGLPVDIPERDRAFESPVVLDVISWLRVLADPFDDVHLTRLLTRPPYNIELPWLARCHREHIHNSKHDAAQAIQSDSQPPSVTFLDRLIERNDNEAIHRFALHHAKLAKAALIAPADDLVRHIVHTAGILSSDLSDPDLHETSLVQLAQFLTLVMQRLPEADPPRRVREFLAHYDHLIDVGNGAVPNSTEVQMDSGIQLSSGNAVRVLTAHSAKGLEFETVILPRINPANGYPTRNRDANVDPLIPSDLLLIDPPDHDDEERRLFFVALTRAKRQVLLLTQCKDAIGRNLRPSTYWNEITQAQRDDLFVEPLTELKDATDPPSLTTSTQFVPADHVDRDRRSRRLRHEVSAVLQQVCDPLTPPAQLSDLAESLRLSVLELAVLSSTSDEHRDKILAALSPSERSHLADIVQEISASSKPSTIAAPTAPLNLSYSYLDHYLKCPRCFWLKHVIHVPEPRSTALKFGGIIHRALEFFYKGILDSEESNGSIRPPTVDDLIRFGRDAYLNMKSPEEPWSRETAQRVVNALTFYHKTMHDNTINAVKVEYDIAFQYECDGESHDFTARIDRLDYDPLGHHVIDYKTGKPTKARLEPTNSDLQLGIYYLALQQRLEDAQPPGSAQYWLTRTGEKGVLPFEKINITKIRRKIDDAIRGILAADWTPKKGCQRCSFFGFDPI